MSIRPEVLQESLPPVFKAPSIGMYDRTTNRLAFGNIWDCCLKERVLHEMGGHSNSLKERYLLFIIMEDILNKRSYARPMLNCLGQEESKYALRVCTKGVAKITWGSFKGLNSAIISRDRDKIQASSYGKESSADTR